MKYLPDHKNLGPFHLKIFGYLLLSILGIPAASAALNSLDSFHPSAVQWELYRQKGSTKVYQAKKSHSSGLVPLKASTILNHPLKKVYSVLSDYNRRDEWVPRLKKSYQFKRIRRERYLAYSLYRSPWPFKNRSVLVDVVDSYDPGKQAITSTITSVAHPDIPHDKSDVRFETKGSLFIKEMDGGKKTYAEITLLNDFKGNIPVWLVNFVQRRWPQKMFKNLNEQLNKKDIQVKSDFFAREQ